MLSISLLYISAMSYSGMGTAKIGSPKLLIDCEDLSFIEKAHSTQNYVKKLAD